MRKRVLLSDPKYFCNKSWTLTFNLNTATWISFMSYIPNWYIGENNFFYSGLAACCSGIDAEFEVLVGEADLPVTTSSTTTKIPRPTTSSTTTVAPDCVLDGTVDEMHCSFSATGVTIIPPSPTTTICRRPEGLMGDVLVFGYKIGTAPTVSTLGDLATACSAIDIVFSDSPKIMIAQSAQSANFAVGDLVYKGTFPDCKLMPDGYYIPQAALFTREIYHIKGGQIIEILHCSAPPTTSSSSSSTTSTTTALPVGNTFCHIITTTGSLTFHYLDYDNNVIGNAVNNSSLTLCIKLGSISGICDSLDITITGGTTPCVSSC